jgi:hypothetical protein
VGWRLEPVYLVISGEHAGDQLEVSWKVTSTSARGSSKGRFRLTVLSGVAHPRDLMARQTPDEADESDEDEL